MIIIKTPEEIKKMRAGGKILAQIVRKLKKETKASISTEQIEMLARNLIEKAGAKPAFLGYQNKKNQKPFPTVLCLSLNAELVHTPSLPPRTIKTGDLVSIDCGIEYQGLFTDMAITFGVGEINSLAKKLIEVTKRSLDLGIKKIKPGIYLGDLSAVIQNFIEKNNFSVVRDLTGHGVGRKPHEEPAIPNFGQPGTGPKLEIGMTLALEPMVNAGGYEIETLADGWTVITKDKNLCAHFEHTVAITKRGAIILTEQ